MVEVNILWPVLWICSTSHQEVKLAWISLSWNNHLTVKRRYFFADLNVRNFYTSL